VVYPESIRPVLEFLEPRLLLSQTPGSDLAIDIQKGSLVAAYDGASPLQAIETEVIAGGGTKIDGRHFDWNGTVGIMTSAICGSEKQYKSLGMRDTGFTLYNRGAMTAVDGVPVPANSVVVKYTWFGDMDLDGKVDINDYLEWFYYYRNRPDPANISWMTGDFNYDGQINVNDYLMLLNGYRYQTGRLGGSDAPGTEVNRQVRFDSGGTHWIVVGTDSADLVTVDQVGASMVVTTASGGFTFAGPLNDLAIYGFGGDDTLRVTHNVTAPVTIHVGGGNVSVFDAGQGDDTLFAGAGNDLLVTVGGGTDHVVGGSGLDSFWVDSSDVLTQVTGAETAATSVHTITQFYEPTTNSTGPVPLEIAGQNLADPLAGYAYQNFSANPLFSDGTQYTDIRQGSVGDCYFMSALASMAAQKPGLVRQSITSLGDGTYAVRFYRNAQPEYIRVDGDLPVYGGTSSPAYARLSGTGETWVALLEKAYAVFRASDNNYISLSGGWMGSVYKDLANLTSNDIVLSSQNAESLAQTMSSQLNAGHLLTAATFGVPTGPFLAGHAYTVMSVDTISGVTYVTLYNPFGYDAVSYDSNPNDGLLQVTMAVFQANFIALSAATQ
jgi:hypothetical protein